MEEVRALTHPQRLNSLGYLINILKTFVKLLKQFVFLFAYIFIVTELYIIFILSISKFALCENKNK